MKPLTFYCLLFAWFLATISGKGVTATEATTEAEGVTTKPTEAEAHSTTETEAAGVKAKPTEAEAHSTTEAEAAGVTAKTTEASVPSAASTPLVSKSLSSSQTVLVEEDNGDGKGPHRTNMTTAGSGLPFPLNNSANANMSSVIPPEAVTAMTAWQNPPKAFNFNDFFGGNAAVVGNGPQGPFAAAGSASLFPAGALFGGQGQRSPFDVFRRLPPRFPPGWDPNSQIRVPTQRPYREPKNTRRRRKLDAAGIDEGLAAQMSPANEYTAYNIWF